MGKVAGDNNQPNRTGVKGRSEKYLREGALGKDAGKKQTLVRIQYGTSRGMTQTHIRRQVLPQAPSPTMTSLRRISAIW